MTDQLQSKEQLSIEQTNEAIEKIKAYKTNPLLFIETFLERKLTDKQMQFLKDLEDPSKRRHVAIWARQTGKSTVLSSYIVWVLLYGPGFEVNGEHQPETILVLAPILEQVINLHEKIMHLLHKNEIIESYLEKANKGEVTAKNKNRIIFLSASPGSHIRGFTASKIFIDESQDVTDAKYYGDIMPFGATTNALIVEAGTPMTKNHFWKVLEDSKKTGSKVTVSKQLWFECPFLSKDYVMAQKAVSPSALWRQEFLCEFVEEGVLVFPSKYFDETTINDKDIEVKKWNLAEYGYVINMNELSEGAIADIKKGLKAGDNYTFGLDLGRSRDYTVLTAVRISEFPLRIAAQIRFELGTSYTEIVKVIKKLYDVYNPVEFNFDYTAEKGFADLMQSESIPIIIDDMHTKGAIVFHVKTKMDMVSTAQVLFEQFKFQLPRITTILTDNDSARQKQSEQLLQQFLNQQFEVSKKDEKVKMYYHPSSENDDMLWSTLLAVKNITSNFNILELAGFHNPWETNAIRKKFEDSEIFVSHAKLGRPHYSTAEDRRDTDVRL